MIMDDRKDRKRKYGRDSSSSSDEEKSRSPKQIRSQSEQIAKEKRKKKKQTKKSRDYSSSSSSSENESEHSDDSNRRKHKKKSKNRGRDKSCREKKEKRKKKREKKRKKQKERNEKKTAAVKTLKEKDLCSKIPSEGDVLEKQTGSSNTVVDAASKKRAMVPMTKEEYEKQQAQVKRVYDPETGRHRLVKGTGEILEEIVSKARHNVINKNATRGDGAFFQANLGLQDK